MNVKIRNIIIIIFLLLLSACRRDGPLLIDVPTDTISAVLDRSIPAMMEKENVVGMSIIVIRGGNISISKSFGYADIKSHRQVDEHTVFPAASLGKPIFAYIVVSLSQQRKLDLDAPLYSYLQEEVVKNDPRSRTITARMVLDHTTGLPNINGNQSEVRFLFDPGTDFNYSGQGYLYLQRVIETITSKQLNQLANEIVFQPLRMADSSYVWDNKYTGSISASYEQSGEVIQPKEYPIRGYSAWSLLTTVEDYARFVSHMIKTARAPGSVAELMLNPQVDVAKGVRWGLGWGLQNTIPNYSFWHWGSTAGFRHYVVGYPDEKLAVVVMTNSKDAFKIVDEVMVKAIGGSYPAYDWF